MKYRLRETLFAFVLAGLGALKAIRIVVDQIDDATRLPKGIEK